MPRTKTVEPKNFGGKAPRVSFAYPASREAARKWREKNPNRTYNVARALATKAKIETSNRKELKKKPISIYLNRERKRVPKYPPNYLKNFKSRSGKAPRIALATRATRKSVPLRRSKRLAEKQKQQNK